jgi:four helix bundle protein
MEKEVAGFRTLAAWSKAYELALATYKISRTFPKEEIYSLSSQLQRAAVSVPANIAEG